MFRFSSEKCKQILLLQQIDSSYYIHILKDRYLNNFERENLFHCTLWIILNASSPNRPWTYHLKCIFRISKIWYTIIYYRLFYKMFEFYSRKYQNMLTLNFVTFGSKIHITLILYYFTKSVFTEPFTYYCIVCSKVSITEEVF